MAAVKEGEAAETGGMPQLDFDTWPSQILWVALALFVLYRILTGSIMPRIAATLENRHNTIADNLDQAANLKQKAEQAQADYEKALADARASANEIAERNRGEIAAKVEEANAKAEAEIAARTAEGEKRIDEIRAEAASSAKSVATEAAQEIIGRLAPGLADSGRIGAAVEDALARRSTS